MARLDIGVNPSMRRAHGDHISNRKQYNLRQRTTDKVVMASKGGNLFSTITLPMFTVSAVYDSAERPILFPDVTNDPQTRRQAMAASDSDM